MSLEVERKAAAGRRWRERVDRTARAVLHAIGRDATPKRTEAYVRETWAGLDDDQVEEVLARVGAMRDETNGRARHLTPKEIDVARRRKTRETKAAIRELLARDPGMTSTEMWGRCRARGVDLTAKSSFSSLCSEVRKEMGISGRKATRRALEKAKATIAGGAAVDHAPTSRSARQQPEEAKPPAEPEAPASPPAVPVAETEDPEPTRWVEHVFHLPGRGAPVRIHAPIDIAMREWLAIEGFMSRCVTLAARVAPVEDRAA